MKTISLLLILCFVAIPSICNAEQSNDYFEETTTEVKESVEETVEDSIFMLGGLCAVAIILFIIFACVSFWIGCAFLKCGFSLNQQYESV
ncbi:CLUMA_CG018572, isoform A [Clunio marinus]|uniref:CLUMA_CG018572, isoform A n=1 Tax=Clunio marinus TaxID=568069 RepID=A0A1J1IZ05_9DIPT|nr:CLUMA_CG018572, isoform A [Clunio marinus]